MSMLFLFFWQFIVQWGLFSMSHLFGWCSKISAFWLQIGAGPRGQGGRRSFWLLAVAGQSSHGWNLGVCPLALGAGLWCWRVPYKLLWHGLPMDLWSTGCCPGCCKASPPLPVASDAGYLPPLWSTCLASWQGLPREETLPSHSPGAVYRDWGLLSLFWSLCWFPSPWIG